MAHDLNDRDDRPADLLTRLRPSAEVDPAWSTEALAAVLATPSAEPVRSRRRWPVVVGAGVGLAAVGGVAYASGVVPPGVSDLFDIPDGRFETVGQTEVALDFTTADGTHVQVFRKETVGGGSCSYAAVNLPADATDAPGGFGCVVPNEPEPEYHGTRLLGRDSDMGGVATDELTGSFLTGSGSSGDYDGPLVVWGDRPRGADGATTVRVGTDGFSRTLPLEGTAGDFAVDVPYARLDGSPLRVTYLDADGAAVHTDVSTDTGIVDLG